MPLLLRTLGTLELLDETGAPLLGAAAQRMPLLILALAALHPEGIQRERLVKALWPGVAKTRARAVLKQHLYALRRATGRPGLLGGAPRLKAGTDELRVDAWEFSDHIRNGRLRDAVEMFGGDLLDTVNATEDSELGVIVAELREQFASEVAMVHAAVSARPGLPPPLPPAGSPPSHLLAGRAVRAAAERFVRGCITLPEDSIAAGHRAAACVHDLLEALRDAELAAIPESAIGAAVCEARALSARSALISTIQQWPRGYPGDSETLEWLAEGSARSPDPVGRALEHHLLSTPIAARYRTQLGWQLDHLTSLPLGRKNRVLLVGSGGAAAPARLLPLLGHSLDRLVLNDPDSVALSLARHRLAPLAPRIVFLEGDCFRRVVEVAGYAPYDLIIVSGLYDGLPDREAAWLTERLAAMLGPAGRLLITYLARGHPFKAWMRYILGWDLKERDRDEIVLLYGHSLRTGDLRWESDPVGMVWGVTLTVREGASTPTREAA